MKELSLKTKLTKRLKKKNIFEICKLKNTQWKYGLKSQINWFNQNIKDNDIHNLAYLQKDLVGYCLLRKRNFFLKKKKYTYLYYDTLIVSKKYRELNIGHQISNLTVKTIKKLKLHSMLICQKKIVSFHKKFNWKVMNKKRIQIIDHKFPKKFSIMCFNQTKKIKNKNINYYIFN